LLRIIGLGTNDLSKASITLSEKTISTSVPYSTTSIQIPTLIGWDFFGRRAGADAGWDVKQET
jgi:hypothetical protein